MRFPKEYEGREREKEDICMYVCDYIYPIFQFNN